MSASTIEPLRNEVARRLATVSEEELSAVNLLLKKLEMLRLRRAVGQAVDDADAAGLMAAVDVAICEHRRNHPYR